MRIKLISIDFLDRHLDSMPKGCVRLRVGHPIDSIECFNKSLEVFTQDKFSAKWQINQEDLSQSQELWKIEKKNLIMNILGRPWQFLKMLQAIDLNLEI